MDRLEEPHIQELIQLFSTDSTSDSIHYVITWTTDKVLDSIVRSPVLLSPTICLDIKRSSCYFTAVPQFYQDSICLKMFIKAPNSGDISCRFGFKSANETKWCEEINDKIERELTITTFEMLSNFFNAATKTIVILCEFFITTKVPKLDDSIIPILESTEYAICVDFYHLYKTGYRSDLTLLIGETELHVHRAILSAKSGVFRKMIEKMAENENTLELSDINLEAMRSMLLYIYTGNFEVWSKFYVPTISLYECVDKFEIVNMKTFWEPFEVDHAQTLLTQELEFEWKIESFSDMYGADLSSKRSPLFQTIFGSFYLSLSYISSDNFFLVNLEPLKIFHDVNMIMEIAISHSEANESKSYELNIIFAKQYIFEIASFTKEDLMISSTTTLPLRNALTISGKCFVSGYDVEEYFSYTRRNPIFYEEFSSFKTLLDNSHFSDMKFITEGREFPAHKSIVGARLLCFKDLFEVDKRLNEISMDEVAASTMESFLLYLYTGKINNEIEILLNLLPIWNKYGNNILGAKLFNLLTKNINVKNVCSILSKLYSLEKTEFFDSLKSAAMNFLCCNFFEIESSEFWDKFVVEKNGIARIVLSILSGAYRKHLRDPVPVVRL